MTDERNVQARPENKSPAPLTEDWDSGEGFEDITADEQLTPILRVLHYQCPQIDKADPAFILGATPGMIMNTATRELFDGTVGLDVVVCGRGYRYAEWIPRGTISASGGSFRGFRDPIHDPETAALIRKLQIQHKSRFMALPWENEKGEQVEFVETGELFVLFAPPPLTVGNARRAMLNFTSKSLAVWKSYNSKNMDWKNPKTGKPREIVAYRWRLSSHGTQNAKGKFFIWQLDLAPPAGSPVEALVHEQDLALWEMARASAQQFKQGQVRYTPEDQEDDSKDEVPDF